MYKPKVIRCRFKTGEKTLEQIKKEEFEDESVCQGDLENMKKMYDTLDGVEVILSLWDYDKYSSYHLYTWKTEADEKIMMAMYYAEQVSPFPAYINDLEQFKEDWKAGGYEPPCAISFRLEDVEELEVIREETKEEAEE